MNLDDEQVRAAYFCAAEALRNRRRNGYPIPDALHRLFTRLDVAVRVSQPGHGTDCGAAESTQRELIGAREAGQILGVSKRQAQRLAADLDGQLASGRWIFDKKTVLDYAKERNGTTGRPNH